MLPESKNLPEIELTVFNSGWVEASWKLVVTGSKGGKFRMPALFALIRHPSHGPILYDTGYNTSFYQSTEKLPYRIMRFLTTAELTEKDNADAQLKEIGVAPDEVLHIILGHGHADHVPGVPAFPKATLIVDRREWEFMQGPALRVFARAYLKSMYDRLDIPLRLIDFEKDKKPYGPFENALDLWGDGSMILTPLPGHTVGQMGLLVNLADGRRFFFIGDAAWVKENYLEMKPPIRPARMILSSQSDFMKTLRAVHDFHEQHPEVVIVPSHCPSTWEKLIETGLAKERPQ